ncbi:hypothetical protein LCGC14_2269490 [marine sediment metagenome]|uniref:Uncharacterized protein n=1 Tax=marine sediment metagenome TaxID=412755 RepID=A0A0F9F9U0_9ZZZZ
MRSAEVQMGAYYDYDRQCWVKDGRVMKCDHREPMKNEDYFTADRNAWPKGSLQGPREMKGCYACAHAGERVPREDEDDG